MNHKSNKTVSDSEESNNLLDSLFINLFPRAKIDEIRKKKKNTLNGRQSSVLASNLNNEVQM